ncbi:YPR158W-B-like protein [Kluyveromyces marxianus]
MTFWA